MTPDNCIARRRGRSWRAILCAALMPTTIGCAGGELYRIALTDVPHRANIVVLSLTGVSGRAQLPRYAHPYLVKKSLPEQWQRFSETLKSRWSGRAGSVRYVPTNQSFILSLPVSALVNYDEELKLDQRKLRQILGNRSVDLVIAPYFFVQDVVGGSLFLENTNKYCPDQNYSIVYINFLILDGRGNLLGQGVDFHYGVNGATLNEVRTDGGFFVERCGSVSRREVDFTETFEVLYRMEGLIR